VTLFRPHRGELADAMDEVVELPSFAALVAHLNHLHREEYGPDRVKVEPYGIDGKPSFDRRVGWHTYIVTVDGMAAGFTNGPLA
jgi:hypothetical protein